MVMRVAVPLPPFAVDGRATKGGSGFDLLAGHKATHLPGGLPLSLWFPGLEVENWGTRFYGGTDIFNPGLPAGPRENAENRGVCCGFARNTLIAMELRSK